MKVQTAEQPQEKNRLPKTFQNAFDSTSNKSEQETNKEDNKDEKAVYRTYIYRGYGGGYQGL